MCIRDRVYSIWWDKVQGWRTDLAYAPMRCVVLTSAMLLCDVHTDLAYAATGGMDRLACLSWYLPTHSYAMSGTDLRECCAMRGTDIANGAIPRAEQEGFYRGMAVGLPVSLRTSYALSITDVASYFHIVLCACYALSGSIRYWDSVGGYALCGSDIGYAAK
eukprot:723865-Rhodomonas_salina.1